MAWIRAQADDLQDRKKKILRPFLHSFRTTADPGCTAEGGILYRPELSYGIELFYGVLSYRGDYFPYGDSTAHGGLSSVAAASGYLPQHHLLLHEVVESRLQQGKEAMRQQTGRPFRKGVHGQCCHTEAGTGQGDRRQAADSEAGITENITSYMARHTWATLAHERNIPIAVISKAMGHTSERTTRIYIAELNSEIVHTANKEITDWRTGLPL